MLQLALCLSLVAAQVPPQSSPAPILLYDGKSIPAETLQTWVNDPSQKTEFLAQCQLVTNEDVSVLVHESIYSFRTAEELLGIFKVLAEPGKDVFDSKSNAEHLEAVRNAFQSAVFMDEFIGSDNFYAVAAPRANLTVTANGVTKEVLAPPSKPHELASKERVPLNPQKSEERQEKPHPRPITALKNPSGQFVLVYPLQMELSQSERFSYNAKAMQAVLAKIDLIENELRQRYANVEREMIKMLSEQLKSDLSGNKSFNEMDKALQDHLKFQFGEFYEDYGFKSKDEALAFLSSNPKIGTSDMRVMLGTEAFDPRANAGVGFFVQLPRMKSKD